MKHVAEIVYMFANIVLNDLGGLPFYRLGVYARALGTVRSALRSNPPEEWNLANQAAAFIGMRSGSFSERWFRYAMYLDCRDLGVSPRGSAEHARKCLFDYEEVGTWFKGAPRFIIFFYKALPYLLGTAVKHPVRFSKWVLAVCLLILGKWVLGLYLLLFVVWLVVAFVIAS